MSSIKRHNLWQVGFLALAIAIAGGRVLAATAKLGARSTRPERSSQSKTAFVPAFERPIRIPARVPIHHAEPPFALAGERSTWRLTFTLSEEIRPGQSLKVDLYSHRNNKGLFRPVQTTEAGKPGYVTARTEDGTAVPLTVLNGKEGFGLEVRVPEAGLPAGAKIHVTLGDRSGGGPGISAPATRCLNKFFALYCPDRVKGGGKGPKWGPLMQRTIVGACTMHVLGNRLDHIRAYVPSQCRPDKEIAILVHPEDEHSNLANLPLHKLEVRLGERSLAARYEPVDASNCARLYVKIKSPGVHRLEVIDRPSGKRSLTNPIRCSAEPDRYNQYWGILHAHSEMSDGWGTIDYYFRQMRDETALDFAASSDHDHLWETPDRYWQIICQTVKRYHEPGRFVTLLGYEWAKWRRNGDGDRNVYYLQDDQPMFRSDDGHYPRPPDLFKALKGKQAIIIPHHPGSDGNHCDYKDHDPEHERFIEIHQIRGCYECSVEDGNPLIARPDSKGGELVAKGFVRRALALGWRIGFTAGGDDHRGSAGTDKPSRVQDGKVIYAGSMAVLAPTQTREAIWEALWNRRVIATSGPRMLLRVDLNGHPIGSELKAADEPALRSSRRLRVWFRGTAPIDRIDVIRNNKTVHTTKQAEFTWDDKTPLENALMPPAKYCPHRFCFYYIRVVQADGQAAWASPIWVDP